jgi:hypothetical protein
MIGKILEYACIFYSVRYSYEVDTESYKFYHDGTCVMKVTKEFISDCISSGIDDQFAKFGIVENITRVYAGLKPLCVKVSRDSVVTLNEECPLIL